MQRYFYGIGIILGSIILALLQNISSNLTSVQAQVRISDTPVRVIIPDETQATAQQEGILTATPTFTPTAPPPEVFLEGIPPLSEVRVLDFPETGVYLGSVESGRQYPITGQYFSWLQFEYAPGPNGRGWVFLDSVRVRGNVSQIRIIGNPQAENASPEDNQTATAQAELLTPSIAETASAEARILIVPTAEASSDGDQNVLPTFTKPADIVPREATQLANETLTPTAIPSFIENAVAITTTRQLPPILPILVLGGLGLFGLLISLIRR